MQTAVRKRAFITQFKGPGAGSSIRCYRFWQLVVALGCPFRCAYCFLQTTPYFVFNGAHLTGMVYSNVGEMIAEVERWLEDTTPKMLIVGELQDGLVFDEAYRKVTGRSLTEWLVPLFAAQRRHRLIFLTKSTAIEHAIHMKATPNVVFSWSVNSAHAAEQWELGAPTPTARFAAARQMKEAGWPIRFRLDPMIPHPEWATGYAATIRAINALRPEMVTLGSLRATSPGALRTNAEKNGRATSVFDYLTSTRDPSGFKFRIGPEDQITLFRFALDHVDAAIPIALCKEDESLWRALGMEFKGCHCLLDGEDDLVSERARTPVERRARRRHLSVLT